MHKDDAESSDMYYDDMYNEDEPAAPSNRSPGAPPPRPLPAGAASSPKHQALHDLEAKLLPSSGASFSMRTPPSGASTTGGTSCTSRAHASASSSSASRPKGFSPLAWAGRLRRWSSAPKT